MSVFNGERYLAEAVESILTQVFRDFEFIIIDDGSTDLSAEIIRSYRDQRIRLFQQGNRGLAPALNVGLRMATAKYIARMDADDISLPERLRLQYEFLEAYNECVAVGSNAIVIDADGNDLFTSDQPGEWGVIRLDLPRTPFYHSSTFFRREAALRCGGYYEPIRQYFEDVIFFNRISRYGELRNIGMPLIKYRLVPSALTNTDLAFSSAVLNIAKNILEEGRVSEADLEHLKRITKTRTRKWKESNYHLRIAKVYLEQNFNRRKASDNLIRAIMKRPLNGIAWANMLIALMPRFLIRNWKHKRYELWDKRKMEVLKNIRSQKEENAGLLGEKHWKA